MIEDVVLTPLKIIDAPDGRVFHAIKNIDPGFDDFGEAYFSEINSHTSNTYFAFDIMLNVNYIYFLNIESSNIFNSGL